MKVLASFRQQAFGLFSQLRRHFGFCFRRTSATLKVRFSNTDESRLGHHAGVPKKTESNLAMNLAGPRIRAARDAHRPPLTQDDLSGRLAAIGVTLDRTAITKVENQTRRIADFELAAIAQALNVNVEWLLGMQRGARR